MAILKLAVGAPITMAVVSAEIVQGKFRPDVKFVSSDGSTIFVGEEVATRQLGRFSLNPTTVNGKVLKFEKVAKDGKTFTNIDVVNGTGGPQNAARQAGATPAASETTQPVTAPTPPPDEKKVRGYVLYKQIAAKYCAEIIPMLREAGVAVTHEGSSAAIAAVFIAADKRN